MQQMGLRESKKAATRLALATAVLRHAADGGLESVSVDTVAAEVGVSTRTFHNYFSGKDDALIYFVGVMLDRMADLIESRPSDDNLWDVVEYALTEIACDPEAEAGQFMTLIRLLESDPALAEHKHSDAMVSVQKDRFEEVLSTRGQTTELGLFERLVFTNALCTLRVALEMWTEDIDTGCVGTQTAHGVDRDGDLRQFLGEAFRMTKSGLGGPVPAHN
jgi:AcrR family transcriptional regulator